MPSKLEQTMLKEDFVSYQKHNVTHEDLEAAEWLVRFVLNIDLTAAISVI